MTRELPSSKKARLRAFFAKYPDKEITSADLCRHFTEMTPGLIAVHTGDLVREGSILRTAARGHFKWNPEYKSPEEKRAIVEQHIAAGQGRPVVQGNGWKPTEPAITSTLDAAALAYLAQQFVEAIIDRMGAAGFTRTEIAFVKRMADERYPLSEQQRIRYENNPSK